MNFRSSNGNIKMNTLPKKLVVEFTGAFFLVFTICVSSGDLAPFAIAGVLTALIFAGGHISGAHYNPAVTVSIWLRGKFPAHEIAPYAVSQVAGAVAAGLTAGLCVGNAESVAVFDTTTVLIAEVLFSFALCFVILNVATARGTAGNSFYGVAIGLVVLAGALAVGSLSGAVFNPAVAVGLFVKGVADAGGVLIYTVASITGGVAAASVFVFLNNGSD